MKSIYPLYHFQTAESSTAVDRLVYREMSLVLEGTGGCHVAGEERPVCVRASEHGRPLRRGEQTTVRAQSSGALNNVSTPHTLTL